MGGPPVPQGYDVAKAVRATHSHCRLTVGFDRTRDRIPRFLVVLHYVVRSDPQRWSWIARFDHNETSAFGHDLYAEGLHVDVVTRSGERATLHPMHGPLPRNRGTVVRKCVEYFDEAAGYFVDVFEGDVSPGDPPGWPDGGEPSPTLIPENPLLSDMCGDRNWGEPISVEELTTLLAEATGTDPQELDREAADFEIGPPEEADVVTE